MARRRAPRGMIHRNHTTHGGLIVPVAEYHLASKLRYRVLLYNKVKPYGNALYVRIYGQGFSGSSDAPTDLSLDKQAVIYRENALMTHP